MARKQKKSLPRKGLGTMREESSDILRWIRLLEAWLELAAFISMIMPSIAARSGLTDWSVLGLGELLGSREVKTIIISMSKDQTKCSNGTSI